MDAYLCILIPGGRQRSSRLSREHTEAHSSSPERHRSIRIAFSFDEPCLENSDLNITYARLEKKVNFTLKEEKTLTRTICINMYVHIRVAMVLPGC